MEHSAEPAPHFVLLQHGSHGTIADLAFLVSCLESHGFTYWREPRTTWGIPFATPVARPLNELRNHRRVVFDSTAVHGLRTDFGLHYCVDKVLPEIRDALHAFVEAHSGGANGGARPRFSAVGHSFGGIMTRHIVKCLMDDPVLCSSLEFNAFVTIATPHLGARELNPVWLAGGEVLGATVSRNYHDLLLMAPDGGPLANELVDDEHIAALAKFRERRLYGSLNNDLLVAPKTSLLLVEGADHWYGGAWRSDRLRRTTHLLPALRLESSKSVPAIDAEGRTSVPLRIAQRLRSELSWTVVPAVSDSWFCGAHVSIVSKKVVPFDKMMDDVGQELAQFIATGTSVCDPKAAP